MADLTTLLNKFLQNLYAGVLDLGGSSTVTIGSGTSVTSVAVGSGTTTALVGGTLFTSTTAAATTGTAEETLMSYTMPANTLAVNGRGVRITAWGSTAANVNAKMIKVYFGTSVPAVITTSSSGAAWRATAYMTRTGAAAQTSWGEILVSASAAAYGAFTATEALTSTVLIKVTGTTATAAGDATATGFMVEAF
jgi:hypothetical protein